MKIQYIILDCFHKTVITCELRSYEILKMIQDSMKSRD